MADLSMVLAADMQPSSASTYEVEDVVVKSTRIELEKQSSQAIDVQKKTQASRPSLEAALQAQSNIQVVPTPLKGSNLSLDGLSGEQVALWWNGDPILGRVDGALDTRMVPIESVGLISVYHGLDSLAYGSQNIAGAIELETPWEQDRLLRLRSGGGTYGRSVLSGQATGSVGDRWNYSASASNWRTSAIRNRPDDADTSADASAKFSAGVMGAKIGATTIAGEEVDVRVGGTGFHDNSRGFVSAEGTEGEQRRIHVYSDIRRKKSNFHASFSSYRNDYSGLASNGSAARTDTYEERSFRAGPELQEAIGNLTLLVGSVADAHSTSSTRLAANTGSVNRVNVGSYLGARYVLGDHWVVGLGTRWDTGPKLFSPRGEIRYLFQTGRFDHSALLETGLGFREATAKEQYLEFSNPQLRYRVVGNPALQTERAWMTALRYNVNSGRVSGRAALFRVDVRDAIGFAPIGTMGAGTNVMTYSNISRTMTYGGQVGSDFRVYQDWGVGGSYQWLRGRNLQNQSPLFLQPAHRVALTAGRIVGKGASLLGQAIWTGRQGFFDVNRNGQVDSEDQAASYWMTNLEAGYGFKWAGVADLVRFFGRVENAFDLVNVETLPSEPRTFLFGASVDL